MTYQCRLNGSSLADIQQPVHVVSPSGDLPGPPLTLGQWMPCSPPLQLYWLCPGAVPLTLTTSSFPNGAGNLRRLKGMAAKMACTFVNSFVGGDYRIQHLTDLLRYFS